MLSIADCFLSVTWVVGGLLWLLGGAKNVERQACFTITLCTVVSNPSLIRKICFGCFKFSKCVYNYFLCWVLFLGMWISFKSPVYDIALCNSSVVSVCQTNSTFMQKIGPVCLPLNVIVE